MGIKYAIRAPRLNKDVPVPNKMGMYIRQGDHQFTDYEPKAVFFETPDLAEGFARFWRKTTGFKHPLYIVEVKTIEIVQSQIQIVRVELTAADPTSS